MNYRDVLLISEDTIKTYTNISDNVAGDYLLPAISVAQRSALESILGTSLVRKIQTLIVDGQISYSENAAYKDLLDEYITDFLCYASVVELIPIVSFKINNVGAARTEEEKATAVSFNEVFKLKDYYADKAEYFALRMQRYIIANYSKYPELSDYKSIEDIRANLYSAAGCSIWLGGARNKSKK